MIKIGQVGCGYWGMNLMRNFALNPHCHIKWVADTQGAARKRAINNYKKTKDADNYAVLLEDPEIDAIVIATPTKTHFSLAKAALEAKKHVFVEKPLATTVIEAQILCQLAKTENLVLMVDHLLLYHPAMEDLIFRVKNGEIGEIYYIHSQRLNLGIVRTDENVLWSLAPHDIAMILELIGDEPSYITAKGGTYLQKNKKIEDVIFMTLAFPKGETAYIHLSWLDPHKSRKFTVIGSKKMVVLDDMEYQEKLRIYNKGAIIQATHPEIWLGETLIPRIKTTEPLKKACDHFIECIEKKKTQKSDGEAGLKVVKILERTQQIIEEN